MVKSTVLDWQWSAMCHMYPVPRISGSESACCLPHGNSESRHENTYDTWCLGPAVTLLLTVKFNLTLCTSLVTGQMLMTVCKLYFFPLLLGLVWQVRRWEYGVCAYAHAHIHMRVCVCVSECSLCSKVAIGSFSRWKHCSTLGWQLWHAVTGDSSAASVSTLVGKGVRNCCGDRTLH